MAVILAGRLACLDGGHCKVSEASAESGFDFLGYPRMSRDDEDLGHLGWVSRLLIFSAQGALFGVAAARFGALRQLLILKSDLCQMFSNGVRRCVLRQIAHASSLPAIVLAGHPWDFERSDLHSAKIVASSRVMRGEVS